MPRGAGVAADTTPGLDTFLGVSRAFFERTLLCGARLLIVGAGEGDAVMALASRRDNGPVYGAPWSFTVAEPSQAALELAQARLDAAGVGSGVSYLCQPLENVDARDFDAAICILTAHAIPDNGARLAFLRAIWERLRPGAPLVQFNFCGECGPLFYEDIEDWRAYAERNGTHRELLDAMVANALALPFVPPAREEELT